MGYLTTPPVLMREHLTGCCPNKNSFERSLKRFQASEKGFGQQPVKDLPSFYQVLSGVSLVKSNI
jgi:hypothetical protein